MRGEKGKKKERKKDRKKREKTVRDPPLWMWPNGESPMIYVVCIRASLLAFFRGFGMCVDFDLLVLLSSVTSITCDVYEVISEEGGVKSACRSKHALQGILRPTALGKGNELFMSVFCCHGTKV